MRFIGFSLLCVVETASLLADPSSANTDTAKLSSRLAAEIRASLPHYSSAGAPSALKTETNSQDRSDLLVLPKVIVTERPPPRVDPNDLMTTKALDRKLARDFKNSLTGLDAILNGFSIPLVGPSMKARGRAAYKARKRAELNDFIESTSAADTKAGAKLNDAAIKMDQAEDWQNRVTGGK
ncbi:MAG: hypothetical protein ABI273_01380 [Lacunisphaera sp.]